MDLSHTNILVVDDDIEYQEIHRRRLERLVQTIIFASNRFDAEKLVRRQYFHAAILDIRLNDKEEENTDGLRIAETIYKQNESTGLIIVSGYGTTDRSRAAFRNYRAVDFLEKAVYTRNMFLEALLNAISISSPYVESVRLSISPSSIVPYSLLDKFMSGLNYDQQVGFKEIFVRLVGPLVPIAPSTIFCMLNDENMMEMKLWSRQYARGYTIRFGKFSTLEYEIQQYQQLDQPKYGLFTARNVTGLRYEDQSVLFDDPSEITAHQLIN